MQKHGKSPRWLSLVLAAVVALSGTAPVLGAGTLTLSSRPTDTAVSEPDPTWDDAVLDTNFPPEEPPAEEESPQEGAALLLEQVTVPGQVTVVLDPYEIQGRGQVFTEPFAFTNEGTEPVLVRIQGLRCQPGPGVEVSQRPAYAFASAASYPTGQPPKGAGWTELLETGGEKKAQLFLRSIETEESLVLGEDPTDWEFLLAPGETAHYELSGNLTIPSGSAWTGEDITVEMRFLLEAAPQKKSYFLRK